MGKYLKFQGVTQLHKFRYQVQTHIILLLSILVTGEAEMEDDPVISGDLRAVQGEPFRYPSLPLWCLCRSRPSLM